MLSQLVTPCHTNLMFEKVHVFRKVSKILSSLTLIKILGLFITLTEKIVQKAKIFVRTNVTVTQKSFVNKNAPI